MIWTDAIVPVTILINWGLCAYTLFAQVNLLDQVRLGATYINISGRQRMLSQRVAFLSTIDVAFECADNVDVSFEDALNDFVTAGQIVLSFCSSEQCTNTSIEALESLYRLTESLSSTHCSVFENASFFLLNMEALVGSLEAETKNRVKIIQFVVTSVQVLSTLAVSVTIIVYSVLTKKRTKKNTEKMDRMVQYLFHEIRNPLNHVVNGIDHILSVDKNLTDFARGELEQCATGGVLITSILNDVLTLASLESKNHVLNTSPSSIEKLVMDTVRVASLTALSTDTTVETDFSDALGNYYVDLVKLTQVMMNLVTNAIKFCGKGKRVVVGASIVSRGSSKDNVCFYVTDNGPGITPEAQQFIFERFKTFSRSSGSGIGLHITQVIVRRMGGMITVISPLPEKEDGTRFEFTLSLTRIAEDSHNNPNSNSGEKESHALKRDVKVLIADDEKCNCLILERRFLSKQSRELGWTTEMVFTLGEVLEKAKSKHFDAILLDEHFGAGQRGSLFIDTLRKNGVRSKIFMASANCSASDNKLYMRRGAEGTIPKPTPSADVLLRVISGVL